MSEITILIPYDEFYSTELLKSVKRQSFTDFDCQIIGAEKLTDLPDNRFRCVSKPEKTSPYTLLCGKKTVLHPQLLESFHKAEKSFITSSFWKAEKSFQMYQPALYPDVGEIPFAQTTLKNEETLFFIKSSLLTETPLFEEIFNQTEPLFTTKEKLFFQRR